MTLLKYGKLQFHSSKFEGEFYWGESRNEVFERFYDAEELYNRGLSEVEYKKIIKDDPEFIDAYNSLGWIQIDLNNYGNALLNFSTAFRIGYTLIPKDFNGEIIWGVIDNRPFLRSLQGLGLSFLFIQEFEKALFYFEKNLKYNPSDNQGIRALAIHCYIALGEYQKVIKLCKSFPRDTMVETEFGKVLAYYKLSNSENAEKALYDALEWHPLVAKELIMKQHEEVKSKIKGTVSFGGKDEAYEYWKIMGQYWTGKELKNFIEAGLKKYSKDTMSGLRKAKGIVKDKGE